MRRARRRAAWRAALLAVVLGLTVGERAAGTSADGLEAILAADWSELPVETVSAMGEGERGGMLVVFLHGYGGRASGYVPLARALLAEDRRIVLPTAVLPHRNGRGALWWEFDEDDWPKPYSEDPSARAWPEPSRQLPRARARVLALVAELRARYAPDQVVLAGHSQGAMLALDVAASVRPTVDAVAAIAGYALLDSAERLAAPAGHRPTVFIAHGRRDRLVPFSAAGVTRRLLEGHGYPVVFEPHPGGHGVEPAVLRRLRAFLEHVAVQRRVGAGGDG